MKRLLIGLAVMAFIWAVQAQAVEVTWQQEGAQGSQGEALIAE